MTRSMLLTAADVRAHLAGRTETRLVVKPQPMLISSVWHYKRTAWDIGHALMSDKAPCEFAPYQVGDLVWGKETWRQPAPIGAPALVLYKADYADTGTPWTFPWHSSTQMPQWAARIWFEITAVRIERLQEITEAGAMSEGFEEELHVCATCHGSGTHPYGGVCGCDGGWKLFATAKDDFQWTWDTNHKTGFKWDDNPWVWVLTHGAVQR